MELIANGMDSKPAPMTIRHRNIETRDAARCRYRYYVTWNVIA